MPTPLSLKLPTKTCGKCAATYLDAWGGTLRLAADGKEDFESQDHAA